MRIFVTSSKDATVYNDNKNQNTGIDQILEVAKFETSEVSRVSRAFIEFDLDDVFQMTASGYITNPTYSIDMKSTKLRELPVDFDLKIEAIAREWDMGLGKRQDDPITTDGVTWNSASDSVAWNNEGGDFKTQTATYNYKQHTEDLFADVTALMENESVENGFAIKFPDAMENDDVHYGAVNFFSAETHTIYKPKLTVDWDDSTISTGSLDEVSDTDNPFVTITNLKKEYKVGNTYKFRIHCRDRYPQLLFTDGSPYSEKYYLPTGSKYSVVDNVTGETIIPFGNSSKLSVDEDGSYFKLMFKGWEAERYYRIVIKVDDGDGDVSIINKNFVFKLIE